MKTRADGAKVVAGAGGVVFNRQGEVLLLRHREGTWVFPKGHIDPGETDFEAAVREVEEEAGVRAYRLDDEPEVTRYTNARGEAREIRWFLLGTDAEAPHLREATFPEGAFLAPKQALARLAFPEDRRLLNRILTRYETLQAGA